MSFAVLKTFGRVKGLKLSLSLGLRLSLILSLSLAVGSDRLYGAIADQERSQLAAQASASVETRPPHEVKVRLRRQMDELTFSALGLSIAARGSQPVLRLQNSEQLTVRLGADPRQWLIRRLSAEGSYQIEVTSNWLDLSALSLRLGAEPVPGRLRLWSNPTGGIDVIAHLDLDAYLAGVLPSEMPASWPKQALKAQAVAARSYMLSVVKERQGQRFHLESTVEDQVYSLAQHLRIGHQLQSQINEILKATRGEILTDAQGDVLRAFYHADCGGHTEEASLVWARGLQGTPSPRGAGTTADPHCPLSPLAQWQVRIARQELEQKLGRYFGRAPDQRKFFDLAVAETTGSGRVSWINVLYTADQEQFHSISSQELRRLLGFGRVRSTRFTWQWVETEGQVEQLKIQGSGHGHGVGLCQWGARALALKDFGYRDILHHYYPQAVLVHQK